MSIDNSMLRASGMIRIDGKYYRKADIEKLAKTVPITRERVDHLDWALNYNDPTNLVKVWQIPMGEPIIIMPITLCGQEMLYTIDGFHRLKRASMQHDEFIYCRKISRLPSPIR